MNKSQPLGMPKQCIDTGATHVEVYGIDQAIKQIEDNLVMLMRSRSILVEHKADIAIRLNLSQQIDFWSQTLKSIEN
jgi:hypothetical protein